MAPYPLGESKPHGLWDVSGNVWEWIDSWYDKEQRGRVLRGGAWSDPLVNARPGIRDWYHPDASSHYIGFRFVSPISSGS